MQFGPDIPPWPPPDGYLGPIQDPPKGTWARIVHYAARWTVIAAFVVPLLLLAVIYLRWHVTWIAAIGTAAVLATRWLYMKLYWKERRRPPKLRDVDFCERCGYPLKHIPQKHGPAGGINVVRPTCPECGYRDLFIETPEG